MPSTQGRDPWQPRCPTAAVTPSRAFSQPGLAAASPQPLQEGIWYQLTGSPKCPMGHAHPDIPCNFLVRDRSAQAAIWRRVGPGAALETWVFSFYLSMSLTNNAWRTLAQHRGIIPCSLRRLCTEQPCAMVPAAPSSRRNREHPGHIHCAASSAVEHSTGSHSPLPPQMHAARQHLRKTSGTA